MKLTNLASSKIDYTILAVLLSASLFIYGYNLTGQPWHGDEITYLGWGGSYFSLIAKGYFSDPCLSSLDDCTHLFHIPAFGLTYSPIRNLLIGLPMYLVNQDHGNFYNWSCYWDCYDNNNGPTVLEMTAGRLLSPLFGSLTVVLSFFIGKTLFNRGMGIVVSLLFLFYDLWLWYSRTIMVEVHYIFFVLLSLYLLLCAFKTERLKIWYFVLSAIVFGIALNSKMLTAAFSGLFFGIILFKGLSRSRARTFGKKNIAKTSLIISSFFLIALLGFFLVEPGFYQNPINEIKLKKTDMDNYNRDVWYIGYPKVDNIQTKSIMSIFYFIIFPSFIEKQILDPSLDLHGNFEWTYPPTYSSIPMTVFFFVGLGYIIYYLVKSKNWLSNELLLIIWFAAAFIFTLVIVKDFSLERYLLPLEISVLFIASFGFWNFTKRIVNNKIKILFASYFIFVHSLTSLLYWQKIYFSPGTTWVNPLHYGTLQESLDNWFTFGANAVFLGALLFMLVLGFKKKYLSRLGILNNDIKSKP